MSTSKALLRRFALALLFPFILLLSSGLSLNASLLATSQVLASSLVSYPVGNHPVQLEYDGENIWVTNYYAYTVTKLRASDGANLGTFPSNDGFPFGITYDGSHIWVVNYSGISGPSLTKLQASNGAHLGTFPLSDTHPWPILYANGLLWITNWDTNIVRALDPNSLSTVCALGVGTGHPAGPAYDGEFIWVGDFDSNTVRKISANGCTEAAGSPFTVGTSPREIAYDGTYMWVVSYVDENVTKLRQDDGSLVGTYPVGAGPAGIAYDNHGSVWITNNVDNSVTRLRTSDGFEIETLPVETGPLGIVAAGDSVWVGNTVSNTVSKITISPLHITPPVANNDPLSTLEDTPFTGNVLTNDTDADDDPLIAIKLNDPTNGVLDFNSDGSFTYTPQPDFNGTDSFTYKANDGLYDSNIATVTITVDPINDPPVLTVDQSSIIVDEGDTASNTGTVSDVEGDSVTLSAAPLGQITNNDDGTWSWSFSTIEALTQPTTITISGDDGHGGISETSFLLTINDVVQGGICLVTSLADSGAGSLREAITCASTHPGPDTIVFDVAGTINILTQLPDLNDNTGGTTIDGTTAPGFTGTPVVVLRGPGAEGGAGLFLTGINITSANNEIRALQIVAMDSQGIAITGSSASDNVIVGCYIGTNGNSDIPNHAGIVLRNAANNRIGTDGDGINDVAERNVVSSNFTGIAIFDGSTGTVVAGNFIGTDATGTRTLPNIGNLITIINADDNVIGGTVPGTGNVIGGSQANNISISSNSDNNVVQGNFIGVDSTGTDIFDSNNAQGVSITGSQNNLIGGTESGARNIISGNGVGVSIGGFNTSGNLVQGNLIGTDITGTVALSNQMAGVSIGGGSSLFPGPSNNVIEGNVISASNQDGISIGGFVSGNLVQNNLIGTDITGTVILDNQMNGVFIQGGSSSLSPRALNNVIEGNVVAGHIQSGITIAGFTSGNLIQGNRIFANRDLGIDLGRDGVTLNDLGDSDIGSNNRQNFPMLTSVSSDELGSTINGTLNSTANMTFTVQFFSNTVCDSSGYGEGETFLGSGDVTTDSSGDGHFAISLPVIASVGQFVSATATDPDANTSEFSECLLVAANNPPTTVGIPPVTDDEDAPNRLIDMSLYFDDTEDTAVGLSYSVELNTSPTLFSVVSIVGTTLTMDYATDANGIADVTIRATDSGGLFVETTFVVTVNPLNDEPVLTVNQPLVMVDEGDAASNNGTVSDVEGDSVTLTASPFGQVSNNGDGTWSWSFLTTDSLTESTTITITGDDGHGGISQISFLLTVNDVVQGGICTVTNLADSGAGSLRAALTCANTHLGPDTVVFNIAGTINIFSQLPVLNDSSGGTVIDGTTAPGYLNWPVVILKGPGTGSGLSGLHLSSGNNEIRGLEFQFFNTGITIAGTVSTGNVIAGNFIGTDGTNATGNDIGIRITDSSNNIIGGTGEGDRNVISGNDHDGILLVGSSYSTLMQGNLIGTNPAGTTAIGNGGHGINVSLDTLNNGIGGQTAAARNLISGNGQSGIYIVGSYNVVQGNFIGTDVSGTLPLGNSQNGIVIDGTSGANGNVIGGTEPGAGNTIAYNTGSGVGIVADSAANAILNNSIHSNTVLGIDLELNGVTANDQGDTDSGENALQNYPVLTSLSIAGGSAVVGGSLNSTANASFTLQFFANTECDASGYGEGETFLGSGSVTTNGSGQGSFSVTLPVEIPAEQVVTTTATDPSGNTSEFSVCFHIVEYPALGDFVILGKEGVWVKQNATIHSGSLGANQSDPGPYLSEGSEVTIGIGATLTDSASNVLGDTVTVRQNATIYDVYYNQIAGQGNILGQQITPVTLPLVPAFPTLPNFTPGTQNFDVASNTTLTLNAGNYGLLKARNQSIVIFNGGVYNFTEWNVGENVKVYFQAPTEIRISGKLDVGQGSLVGPSPQATTLHATGILIYVNGQNGNNGNLNATPDAAKFGINSTVIANVYVPNGTLWLRDGSHATGGFLGRWVIVGIGAEVTFDSAW